VRDPLEDWIRKDAALAGTFSVQQPGVDRTCGVLELAQAGDAPADPQVGELMTVSMRRARPSLRYCLIREWR
jgi:hypothetical protein